MREWSKQGWKLSVKLCYKEFQNPINYTHPHTVDGSFYIHEALGRFQEGGEGGREGGREGGGWRGEDLSKFPCCIIHVYLHSNNLQY